MISIKSLQEQFLPNVYVKNITLDSQPTTVVKKNKKHSGYIVPSSDGGISKDHDVLVRDGTTMSTLVLSNKFAESKTLQSDLLTLANSLTEFSFDIYVHQTTSPYFYGFLMEYYGNPSLLYAPGNELSITEDAVQVLLNEYNGITGFGSTTKKFSFKDSLFDSLALNQSVQDGSFTNEASLQNLPRQILPDGTAVREVITRCTFENIPKNAEFLAYVIFTVIRTKTDVSKNPVFGDYYTGPYISNIRKEIVLLDGKIQNQAIQFRIAQPSASPVLGGFGGVPQVDAAELSKFGKPGDIWSGGVHIHNNRFMAGAAHLSAPHPFLDYSIVPNNKFVDNRIKEKIQKSIINVTKTFENLNSFVSMYKNNPKNVSLFKEQQNFISDIFLTQGKKGQIQGSFFIDKFEAIRHNSVFSFLFDNAERAFPGAAAGFEDALDNYSNFIKEIISDSSLRKCQVYRGSELLGTISAAESDNFISVINPVYAQVLLDNGYPVDDLAILAAQAQDSNPVKKFSSENQTTLYFSLQNESQQGNKSLLMPVGDSEGGYDSFSFKHIINDPYLTTQKYSVVVEYTDPTVTYMQGVLSQINNFSGKLDSLLTFCKSKISFNSSQSATESAFDYTTENLKAVARDKMIQNGLADGIFPANTIVDGAGLPITPPSVSYPKGFGELPFRDLLVIFYNPESQSDLFSGAPGTALEDFTTYMLNLANLNTTTLSNLLVLKDFINYMSYSIQNLLNNFLSKSLKTTTSNPYTNAVKSVESTSGKEAIRLESSEQEIHIYNYGYDFTGLIDAAVSETGYFTINESGVPTFTTSGFVGRKKNGAGIIEITANDYRLTCDILLRQVLESSPPPASTFLAAPFKPINLQKRSYNKSFYSYLSAPASNNEQLKQFILMPEQFSFMDSQTAFTQIAKLKLEILENNAPKPSEATIANTIKEDLISILNKDGTNLFNLNPFAPGEIVDLTQVTEPGTDFKEDMLNPSDNPINFLNDSEGNKFKLTPGFVYNKNSITDDKNNLLMSLFARKMTGKVNMPFGGFSSFELPMKNFGFVPTDANPPNQVLCLSLENPDATLFKKYSLTDQGYIVKGMVNPARLSQFYFTHQNIVRVEYLSGFKTTFPQIPAKTTLDNPYSAPEDTIYYNTNRNLKSPQWKILDNAAWNLVGLQTNGSLLCRLVYYTSNYINGELVNNFKLPLINSYFKLIPDE